MSLSSHLEIEHSRVVVFLAWEQGRSKVCRMRVRKGMVVGVPAPEAQVKAADARPVIIDHHDLLMMGPELDIIWEKETKSSLVHVCRSV